MSNPRPQEATGWRSEGRWVCGLILVVLAVNLLTGTRCPAVWADEVIYLDPALNLLEGRGFTSSAYYVQPEGEFWAGNVPLYSGLLYVWIGLFGTTILSVRSLDYVLISAAAVLLWVAVKRLGLIARPRYRIVLLALVLLGFGVCFNYRSARPDCLCILLASSALLAASIPNRTVRLTVLGILGILLPAAGLQLVVFAGLLSLLLLPMLRGRILPEAVAMGLGCVAGGGLLFALYTYHGVWDTFLAFTMGQHSAIGAEGLSRWSLRRMIPSTLKDPSSILVLTATFTTAGFALWRGRLAWRSPLAAAVVIAIGLPAAMLLLRGVYPAYYVWMTYIPVCICLCSALSAQPPVVPRSFSRLCVPALLTAACMAGLPSVVGLTLWQWNDRDYRHVEQLVHEHVKPGDCVYDEGAAYYAVKPRAEVQAGFRRLGTMTPQQKDRASVLVIDPGQLQGVQHSMGGQWQPASNVLRPSRGPWLGMESEYFLNAYTLQVFRRKTTAEGIQ